MRIAHVVSDYLPDSWGGTPLHVRDLCRGLRARGHEVAIFAGQRGDATPEYTRTERVWEGVPVTAVTYNFRDFDRFSMLWTNPRMDACFGEWLRAARPDLVHFHHLSGLSVGLVSVAAEAGLPRVMTLHDWWLVCPRGQRLHPDTLTVCEPLDRGRCLPCLRALWPHLLSGDDATGATQIAEQEEFVRRALASCDVLIAPSAFHRDRYVRFGVDPARCFAVPHGLSRKGFPDTARPPRPARRVGFIGTILPSKGVHVLLDAFRQLGRPDLGLDLHGAIVPYHGDTSYEHRLRTLAEGLDVVFHGAYTQDDLPAILAGIDVLVVPSIWWESFCLTIREGALAGVPVVASRLGAMQEATATGLALGFTPGDAGDLAQVLGRLLDDDELRARMSRRAHLVRSLESCVEQTEYLYERARARG